MVELVDDDHIEVVLGPRVEIAFGEALHRGEDVIERARAVAADPQLAERMIA
nr:hypothetical protein [Actinoplanes deccanensis]